jgi:hypothetical protein
MEPSAMEVFMAALENAAKAYGNEEAARIVNEWKKKKSISGGDYNLGRRILGEIAEKRYAAQAKLSRVTNARKRAKAAAEEVARLEAKLEMIRKARDRFK